MINSQNHEPLIHVKLHISILPNDCHFDALGCALLQKIRTACMNKSTHIRAHIFHNFMIDTDKVGWLESVSGLEWFWKSLVFHGWQWFDRIYACFSFMAVSLCQKNFCQKNRANFSLSLLQVCCTRRFLLLTYL